MGSSSVEDLLQRLGTKLKTASQKPNIFGYKPHPKQELFHSSQARNRLYIGGNRAGKSTAGIAESVWYLTNTHPYRDTPPLPVHGRIVGADFDHDVEMTLKPKLSEYLPLSQLKGGSWDSAYSRKLKQLSLENGSTVEFMSYDQDPKQFASVGRHFTHFDEEPPEEIFNECQLRLLDFSGSWWMTLTPVQGMEWMYDKIYMPGKKNTNTRLDVIEVETDDNPYLPAGEIQSIFADLDDEEIKIRRKGEFIVRGGLVYKMFDIKSHVIDFWVPPASWKHYMSLDHGYNNPTSVHWHAVSPDRRIITYSEHYRAEMIVSDHAKIIKNREQELGIRPDIRVGDPSITQRNAVRGTSIQQEYADHGVNLVLGNNDLAPGINKVATYLTPRGLDNKPMWYFTRNCNFLIWEIQRYKWEVWQNKTVERRKNKQQKPREKDNHACDDIRYFASLLPDLGPISRATKQEDWQNVLKHTRAVPVTGRIDENLARQMRDARRGGSSIEDKYTRESLDEFAGGIW